MPNNTKAAELAEKLEALVENDPLPRFFTVNAPKALLTEAAALLRASEGRVPVAELRWVDPNGSSWCVVVTDHQALDGLPHKSPLFLAAPHPPAQQAEPDDDGDLKGVYGPLPEHGWDDVPAVTDTTQLKSALNAMLTYFGMDEDAESKPVFDKARKALEHAGQFVPGGQPADQKTRWIIRHNDDGEFGQQTGWLYRDGGHPCAVTGKPVYVWAPLSELLARFSPPPHKAEGAEPQKGGA